MLEKEIAPHADFIIWHALISPLLDFREVTVTPLGEGAYHVRAVVQNTGWLPTNITEHAKEKKLLRPLEVELTLPDGAEFVSGVRRAEAGQLAGRALKTTYYWADDATTDRAKVEWVVRAAPGSTLTLTASHQRAGRISKAITV